MTQRTTSLVPAKTLGSGSRAPARTMSLALPKTSGFYSRAPARTARTRTQNTILNSAWKAAEATRWTPDPATAAMMTMAMGSPK